MVALVRHDAGAPVSEFVCVDVGTRADAHEIEWLYGALDHVSGQDNPPTARLLAAGRRKMPQKVIEEAGEVALEAVRHRPRAGIRESADLVYQLVILWRACGIAHDEVWGEMRHRADTLGIAEKLPKPAAQIALAVGRV